MSYFQPEFHAIMTSGGKDMTNIMKKLKDLSSLNLFFWSVLWLMLILTVGTIDQKNIGLFESQEKYFTSLFFTYRGIPVPSGGLVILLMTVGLISQLVFRTKMKNKKSLGITLTHFGAVLLLAGAFITNLTALEGSMVIPEGSTLSYMEDYKNLDFVLREEPSDKTAFLIGTKKINLDETYKLDGANLRFSQNYVNCELSPRQNAGPEYRGMASQFGFREKPKAADNTACIEFSIIKDGVKSVYAIYQFMPKEQTVVIGDKTYVAEIRHHRIPLPFSVKLIDFEKKFHQDTMISRSFKSEVYVIDGSLETRHLIEMNAPLRYKGYTFYQSSFSENAQGEITELSVVKNAGQIFPYISSIIICLGLLLHLLINSKKFFKTESL